MCSELLPCPFCGSNDIQFGLEIEHNPDDIVVFVRCKACGARTQGSCCEIGTRVVPEPRRVMSDIESWMENELEDWNWRNQPKADDRAAKD